ncbi:hypothetical protein SDC9_154135 [bioreactor metagenome]|uniref:Uncharacterized protein n=1 Tax=bioreactor metagenome TaxID=1076179 RepID=A0A645EXV1_9ZZZZ
MGGKQDGMHIAKISFLDFLGGHQTGRKNGGVVTRLFELFHALGRHCYLFEHNCTDTVFLRIFRIGLLQIRINIKLLFRIVLIP